MASVRFADFELNIETQELARGGSPIGSGGKAIGVLTALLEARGDLVTRDQLRQHLWGEDVFVDFDANLNAAVRRLRTLLGDPADESRFVQTLPGRGYRFIGQIAEAETPPIPPSRRRALPRRGLLGTCAVVLFAAIAALAIPGEGTPRLSIEIAGSEPGQDMTVARLLNEELAAEVGLVYPSAVVVVAAAGESNAQFRLRGLISTRDDRLAISLRLMDEQAQVWADAYTCELRNIDAIKRKAVQELGVALGLQRHEPRRPAAAAVDPKVYRLYAAAREDLHAGRLDAATASLNEALVRHPAHAPSLAALAEVLLARSEAPSHVLRESQSRALEALRIDYTLAAAHSVLGWARFRQGAREQAERDLRRAVRLDPSDRLAQQRLRHVTGG
jgi:DNA-binding winged helix-turn-helix (wHTH) protein